MTSMSTTTTGTNRLTSVSDPSNGAQRQIEEGVPYTVETTIVGAADLLFHSWNCEAVAEKAAAAKGSKAKKTDDIESYVRRDDKKRICLPGAYLRACLVNAGRFRQDPRSPRKSAMDLVKAGITPLTALAPLNGGTEKWDFEHKCRHVVQRNGITRTYPAFKEGWTATFSLCVNLPEYISAGWLQDLLVLGGRVIGVGDMRPTYGRFRVSAFSAKAIS